MQAQIPQYIEVEDKIIGPLTIRQFIYIIIGLGIIGLLWVLFKLVVVILLAPLIIAFFGAAAFYKVNGRPFLSYVAAFIRHSASPNRFTWQHDKDETKSVQRSKQAELSIPKKGTQTLSSTVREQRQKNLFQIAWQMDVGGKSEDENEPPIKM